LKYKMLLGGRRIDGVIDVKETVRRDIREYISVGGEPFCSDRGNTLRSWTVTAELCLYDSRNADDTLSWLKETADSGKAKLLSVNWEMGGFSARVLLREVTVDAITDNACTVRMQLLEYAKATLSRLESSRAGDIPDPPGSVAAKDAYMIITKYQSAGESVRVKNPETGVEIKNLAVIDGDDIVLIEKAGRAE